MRLTSSVGQGSWLVSVAATGESDHLWAVGVRFRPTERPFIEYWSGSRWYPIPVPKLGGRPTSLSAVRARTASDAWAVGWVRTTQGRSPLVLHWNGDGWRPQPTPAV